MGLFYQPINKNSIGYCVFLLFGAAILSGLANGCRQILPTDDINSLENGTLAEANVFSIVETDYFKANELLGGDVTIINSKLEGRDFESQKTFTVDVAS